MNDKQLEIYKIARSQEGVAEFEPGSNPRIEEYHASTSFGKQSDNFPWCGSFMAWVCIRAGVKPPKDAAAARSWLSWGEEISEPQVGDIVILQRGKSKSQAHIALFEGYHKSMPELIKCFGGNQGNEVCSQWFQKINVLAYRRYKG